MTEHLVYEHLHEIASVGHVEIFINFAKANKIAIDEFFGHTSCLNGRLSLLKYLVVNKYADPNKYMLNLAVEYGHIKVVKWLLSRRCPCDEEACELAAEKGNLKILKCLRSRGCPWVKQQILSVAHENGHSNVINWVNNEQ